MRFAYADPPYMGQAKKHYGCPEIDHEKLIAHLMEFDSWALSCSSPSLKEILDMCPNDIRIAAWVKPFHIFKPNVNPSYGWEPVIFWHPRKRTRAYKTTKDFVSCNITLKKGLCGAKPEAFCFWLFDLLGVEKDDYFEDFFPGTFAVTKALEKYRSIK